jgi:transposase
MSFGPALDALPHKVRSRVSRKLEAARQRVEDAQKHVTKTVVSAQRDLGEQGWDAAPDTGLRRSEPVVEEERMAVLQMLEQGKITVQEAEKLIAALEGKA